MTPFERNYMLSVKDAGKNYIKLSKQKRSKLNESPLFYSSMNMELVFSILKGINLHMRQQKVFAEKVEEIITDK